MFKNETKLEKISRILSKQGKAQEEDKKMEDSDSEEDRLKEPSENEDQQKVVQAAKSEDSVVSEDDIF